MVDHVCNLWISCPESCPLAGEDAVDTIFRERGRHLSWKQTKQLLQQQGIFVGDSTCQAWCKSARQRCNSLGSDACLVGFEGAGAGIAVPVEDGGRGKRVKRASVVRIDLDERPPAAAHSMRADEVADDVDDSLELAAWDHSPPSTPGSSPAASRAASPVDEGPEADVNVKCYRAIRSLLKSAGRDMTLQEVVHRLHPPFAQGTLRNNHGHARRSCNYHNDLPMETHWPAYRAGPPPEDHNGTPSAEASTKMNRWFEEYIGTELEEAGEERKKAINKARVRYTQQTTGKHSWVGRRRRWNMRTHFGYSIREAFVCDYVDMLGERWEQSLSEITIQQCEICQETRPSFMTTTSVFELDEIMADAETRHLRKNTRDVVDANDVVRKVQEPLFRIDRMRDTAMAKLRPCDGKLACARCRTPTFTELQNGVLKFSAANRALLPQPHELESIAAFTAALRDAHAAHPRPSEGEQPCTGGSLPADGEQEEPSTKRAREAAERTAERAARTVFDDAWPEEIALVRMAVPCIEIKALKQGGTVSKTHSVCASHPWTIRRHAKPCFASCDRRAVRQPGGGKNGRSCLRAPATPFGSHAENCAHWQSRTSFHPRHVAVGRYACQTGWSSCEPSHGMRQRAATCTM